MMLKLMTLLLLSFTCQAQIDTLITLHLEQIPYVRHVPIVYDTNPERLDTLIRYRFHVCDMTGRSVSVMPDNNIFIHNMDSSQAIIFLMEHLFHQQIKSK